MNDTAIEPIRPGRILLNDGRDGIKHETFATSRPCNL
jgi:hypothetical protein